MQSLLKKLLIILFLSSSISLNLYSNENNKISLLLLDKSASSKYELNFDDKFIFRDITFELIACGESAFDKYIDQIALMRIEQNDEIFIGWFFKYTDELNIYSNKIYEITLKSCIIKS